MTTFKNTWNCSVQFFFLCKNNWIGVPSVFAFKHLLFCGVDASLRLHKNQPAASNHPGRFLQTKCYMFRMCLGLPIMNSDKRIGFFGVNISIDTPCRPIWSVHIILRQRYLVGQLWGKPRSLVPWIFRWVLEATFAILWGQLFKRLLT